MPTPLQVSDLRADTNRASQEGILRFLRERYLRLPIHMIDGAVPSNDAGDVTNDIAFTSGLCISTNGFVIPVPAYTKKLDTAWSAGDDGGGLGTGAAVANTTYHWFGLLNPATGATDIGADTSVTAANLLALTAVRNAGLAEYCRIFSLVRAAGAITPFTAREIEGGGLEVLLATPAKTFGINNPGTSGVLRAVGVPIGIQVTAILRVFLLIGTEAVPQNYVLLVTSPDQADTTPTQQALGTLEMDSTLATLGAGSWDNTMLQIRTNTSGQVRFRMSKSTAAVYNIGTIFGHIDARRS